jgi:predicted nuclease of predicted toxin-antitoxin system
LKVLFDENVPKGLRHFLKHGHEIRTSQEEDLTATKNDELLRAAENRGFQVLVTSGKNPAYQQNMRGRKIALVVLPLNDWSQLKPIGARISAMVDEATENSYQALELSALTPRRARSRREP